jgi:hypothetical protein
MMTAMTYFSPSFYVRGWSSALIDPRPFRQATANYISFVGKKSIAWVELKNQRIGYVDLQENSKTFDISRHETEMCSFLYTHIFIAGLSKLLFIISVILFSDHSPKFPASFPAQSRYFALVLSPPTAQIATPLVKLEKQTRPRRTLHPLKHLVSRMHTGLDAGR